MSSFNKDGFLDYIVFNGSSKYSVTYDANDSACEYACKEFVSFIAQSTGVQIPVNQNATENFISIGNTEQLNKIKNEIDTSLLKDDGFCLYTKNNNLYILGYNGRGNIYGVYEFLERYMDLKFVAYDETLVPQRDNVPLYNLNVIDNPAFKLRVFYSEPVCQFTKNKENVPRFRMNHEFVDMPDYLGGNCGWCQTLGMCHNTLKYVPVEKYFYCDKNSENYHPEFYNVINGKPKDLCFTNGITEDGKLDESMQVSVVKVLIESLKQCIIDNPQDSLFMIAQEDGSLMCGCDHCKPFVEKYGYSGIMVRFVNVVAKEIERWQKKTCPDRTIQLIIFAYEQTSQAPCIKENGKFKRGADGEPIPIDETVIMHPMTVIRIAPDQQNAYYPIRDKRQCFDYDSMIAGWAKLCKSFMFWTYETCFHHYFMYFPATHNWKTNLLEFKRLGAIHAFIESSYLEANDWQAIMGLYVCSKLLWNPDKYDTEQLKREFNQLYYGKIACEYVEKIMGVLDRHYEKMLNPNDGTTMMTCHRARWLIHPEHFPIELFETVLDILKQAEDAVIKNEDEENKQKILKRLSRIKLTPLYMIMHNYDYYYNRTKTMNDKTEFVKEFMQLCVDLGVKNISETAVKSVRGYLDRLNVNVEQFDLYFKL